ncbi:ABC-type uncharacterized transport system substrate-binding protein [Mangrovibacter plantisponsor]|uniref:ABC-type uncharacterized transport system substrate-binding protein n=2 Tax=Enterobacteriaceae TaxID=543 RepID=A0A317PZX5_9ENTR|nr:ABC-type uncharacterized transport system substrate-binding protein [Mangrovibacter plantisponsor]
MKYKWILLMTLTCTGPLLAHPHSFIDIQTHAVGDTQLSSLQMRWEMDEVTSADLLYDAGEAPEGDAVWQKLAQEVMDTIRQQHYFTTLWYDQKPVKLQAGPDSGKLYKTGHKAVLSFTLVPDTPLALAGHTFRLQTYDPTYYVDMSWVKDSDVTWPGECKVAVKTPKPDADMRAWALSLDNQSVPDEDLALGEHFAQKVEVTCP